MRFSSRFSLLIALSIAAVMVVIGSRRLALAQRDVDRAIEQYHTVLGHADAVRRLRAKEERISLHARPTEDVIALVTRALEDAGLPPDCLTDLRNESDVALPATAGPSLYRKQSITFTLRSRTPGELGVFLEAWHRVQTVWSISRLTLTSTQRRGGSEEGRFDLGFTVSAIYLGDE